MAGSTQIKPAAERDIPVIVNILEDTVKWLNSTDKPMWTRNQVQWERLLQDFAVSDFHIAYLDGVPAGCMALMDHDPGFWPDIQKGESLFVHKLAVKRFAAGQGLADAIIAYAKSLCMDKGISALRLICAQDRPKLRAVYERNGFACVAKKIVHREYPTVFYTCKIRDTRYLYHYYEKGQPPFRSISALPFEEAEQVLIALRKKNENLVYPNIRWFLEWRYNMDQTIRDQFVAIGGKPVRTAPVFCSLGANRGISTWFEDTAVMRIPVEKINLDTISFTYGDTLAVFNPQLDTGEDYWGKVFKYDEMLKLVDKYGWPEDAEYDGIK